MIIRQLAWTSATQFDELIKFHPIVFFTKNEKKKVYKIRKKNNLIVVICITVSIKCSSGRLFLHIHLYFFHVGYVLDNKTFLGKFAGPRGLGKYVICFF